MMESQWKRIEKPHQLKLIFGANLNILVSSVTLCGRAENNLQNRLYHDQNNCKDLLALKQRYR